MKISLLWAWGSGVSCMLALMWGLHMDGTKALVQLLVGVLAMMAAMRRAREKS